MPGAQVPERFPLSENQGEALLDDVLRHNEQDILSMARLLFALTLLHEKPLTAAFQEELYSLGRIFERRGEVGRARQCYRAVGGGRLGELAAVHIAESYRGKRIMSGRLMLLKRFGCPGAAARRYTYRWLKSTSIASASWTRRLISRGAAWYIVWRTCPATPLLMRT